MVNMVKVLVAVTILSAIISIGLIGKKTIRTLNFKTAKTQNTESLWMQYITGTLAISVAITSYLQKRPDATIMMAFGILVYFLGWLLQIKSTQQLYEDKTFEERLSTGFEAAQTGLYATIRHPNKSALLLIIIGLCISLGSGWALGLTVALFFPSLLYRISQEEQTLQDKFGDRWQAYQSDTKKIIPTIL